MIMIMIIIIITSFIIINIINLPILLYPLSQALQVHWNDQN